MLPLDDSIIARFESKVDRSGGPDACWPWLASCDRRGYGQFMLRKQNLVRAHRIAWELAHGPITEDPDAPKIFVCHSCDNPPCCNPAHLWLGTHTDNMRDMARKGRNRYVVKYGDDNPARKHPERMARGDRNGARLHPERMPRGDRNGSRLHPERLSRGDAHYSRTNPERLARGKRHGSRPRPESPPQGEPQQP